VSPHYDRHVAVSGSAVAQSDLGDRPNDDAMQDAAEALRQAEVEAVKTDDSAPERTQLETMSIDELRVLAARLDVPNRGAITEQDQLITAIRRRMAAES
jgi:hypothetical protein